MELPTFRNIIKYIYLSFGSDSFLYIRTNVWSICNEEYPNINNPPSNQIFIWYYFSSLFTKRKHYVPLTVSLSQTKTLYSRLFNVYIVKTFAELKYSNYCIEYVIGILDCTTALLQEWNVFIIYSACPSIRFSSTQYGSSL